MCISCINIGVRKCSYLAWGSSMPSGPFLVFFLFYGQCETSDGIWMVNCFTIEWTTDWLLNRYVCKWADVSKHMDAHICMCIYMQYVCMCLCVCACICMTVHMLHGPMYAPMHVWLPVHKRSWSFMYIPLRTTAWSLKMITMINVMIKVML